MTCFNSTFVRRALTGAGILAAAVLTPAQRVRAATPADTVKACYVNGSGTMYRIKALNAPLACTRYEHTPMQWPDGKGDDYARYLLVDGARTSKRGFAVIGGGAPALIPASGGGVRMMWFAPRAAFRAGSVISTEWDEDNIGWGSVAMGVYPRAKGKGAVALGWNVSAKGARSVAIGSDAYAVHDGSVVIGAGTGGSGSKVENQFVVRAQHICFCPAEVKATPGRYIETDTGAYLSTGGTWTNSSDVNRKHLFQPVNAEQLLDKVGALPIQSWSYKADTASVRHIGPTAQDFHAAFGLGDTDKAIATVDADGVSLAAIQALAFRNGAQGARIEQLERANAQLMNALADLTGRVASLEAAR
jgi:hypothetical protein